MRPRLLLNRDFFLLWQGQLVSQFGNQAFLLGMMYWLMEATGSASLMGLLMMCSLLPGVVIGPLAGALVDRLPRRRVIVSSDLLRGAAMMVLVGVMFFFPDSVGMTVRLLFLVALFNGVVSAVFRPAIAAAIPDLVRAKDLARANALNQFSVQSTAFVGQAAGGLLYRILGARNLFLIDGTTYLISALSEAFIRFPRLVHQPVLDQGPLATYLGETVAGFNFVWERVGMRLFLLVSAAVNFAAMPVILLLPFYVTERLLLDSVWYGFLLAALSAGSLLGYLVVGATVVPANRRRRLVSLALFGVGSSLAMVGLIESPILALAGFFIVGTCTGAVNCLVITLFQAASPQQMRGRVMALVLAVSGAVAPLGMVFGGLLGDIAAHDTHLIYPSSGTAVAALALCVGASRRIGEFLEQQAPELA